VGRTELKLRPYVWRRFAAEGSEDDGAWERGAVEDGRMVSGRTLQDESRSFAGKALGEGGR